MYSKERLESQLSEIAQLISVKYTDHDDNLGVLAGISGAALFQFYYSKHTGSEHNADIGAEIIAHCIEKINAGFSHPSYCNGIAGMAWVIQHLDKEGFIELDSDHLLSQFDDFLFDKMRHDLGKGRFDFLHGGLGYAFYFFKRFKETQDLKLRKKYQSILVHCISEMERLAVIENNMAKWPSVLDPENNIYGYNLGAAHGVANILNFFSRLHKFNEFGKLTRHTLELGVKYLRTVQNATSADISLFPNAVVDNSSKQYKSRLAWCHGDLGIGISMMHVAEALNNPSLMENSLFVLQQTTKRKNTRDTMVVDAGFCHGSYGNAHMYHVANYHKPCKLFEDSINFWIGDGLNKAKHQDGYVGYKQLSGPDRNWTPSLSILEGISGIGLVMIDLLSSERNTWDECLMIGK